MKASIVNDHFVFMSSECHALFLKVKDITYEKYLALNMGWNAAFYIVSFQTPTMHLGVSLGWFSWHFSQSGFEICFSQILWVEVVQSGLLLLFLLKWSQTWKLLDAWACLWWNHSSFKVLVSSFLFREMHRPEVFYMSLTIVYHTFCLHHPKPTGTWEQTHPTLCPSGALHKHFRKTQAIQPTVHCTSITERCTLSRQDVLQCLVNLTYLPKIMVSIQSESLKFCSYKTGEPTIAAPLDCRLGPGVVR